MSDEQRLAAAGIKLVTRAQFGAAGDVPPMIREIARRVIETWGGDFVTYEPAGGDSGWLLIGDRAEIVAETIRDRCMPKQPSLL